MITVGVATGEGGWKGQSKEGKERRREGGREGWRKEGKKGGGKEERKEREEGGRGEGSERESPSECLTIYSKWANNSKMVSHCSSSPIWNSHMTLLLLYYWLLFDSCGPLPQHKPMCYPNFTPLVASHAWDRLTTGPMRWVTHEEDHINICWNNVYIKFWTKPWSLLQAYQ